MTDQPDSGAGSRPGDAEKVERDRLVQRMTELNADQDFMSKLKDFAAAGKLAMTAKSRIRLRFYLFRLNDISVFAIDVVRAMSMAAPQIARDRQIGATRLLAENADRLLPGLSPQEREAEIETFWQQMDSAARQKLDQYERWVCNQSLISLFTVLESFLSEVVDAALRIEPKFMSDNQVRVAEILNPVGASALDDVRAKVVGRFEGKGLAEKLRYLDDKLRIPTERVFDWSFKTIEAQSDLEGYDYDRLMRLNDDRNDIVHRDSLPIRDVAELCGVANFFQSIVLSITDIAIDEYDVGVDFGLNSTA